MKPLEINVLVVEEIIGSRNFVFRRVGLTPIYEYLPHNFRYLFDFLHKRWPRRVFINSFAKNVICQRGTLLEGGT
jgi:hypothetical protein